MYVKKFEADTLDEALKSVKKELGPDAIILKTTSNKGLKGALRKKVQVTAAISERSYGKKSKVDQILSNDQKEKFYKNPSNQIAQTLETYSEKRANGLGYGELSLNKSVKTSKASADLDSFLGAEAESTKEIVESQFEAAEETSFSSPKVVESTYHDASSELTEEIIRLGKKIKSLEERLVELSGIDFQGLKSQTPALGEIYTTLRTLSITDKFNQKFIRRAQFELNDEDLGDPDTCYDFCLREMAANIQVQMPLFSRLEEAKGAVVTTLISESNTGQTSIAMKLAALKSNSVVIQFGMLGKKIGDDLASAKFLGVTVLQAESFADVLAKTRVNIEEGKSVFIDFRNPTKDLDETKNLVDGIRRSFPHSEAILSISSIHSDSYNKKTVNRYRSLVQGMIVSHFDLSLDHGEIFNLQFESKIPLMFFGTGPVIPDDIEAASAERLLSRMFNL